MALMVNDGSSRPPAFKVFLNLANLLDLPAHSAWKAPLAGVSRDQQLARDGFEGVQLVDEVPLAEDSPLPHCGLDRINRPEESDGVAAKHAARGDICITVHVGWGTEDDADVDRLVESVLKASEKHRLPIFIETHRATITQDMWRTVRITRRFPEVRFNCDFSHYYCGQELVYGEWKDKMAFMAPIFERTGFMHGRISSPGCMQVAIEPDPAGSPGRPKQAHGVANFLEHFEDMWTRAMSGFVRNAKEGDVLIFAPELLAGTYYYARKFPDATGQLQEESDRYAEAMRYAAIARRCFAATRAAAGGG
ncbi:MAG: hypothetical protein ACTHN5_19820 [Phycisphaerae bacterium]